MGCASSKGSDGAPQPIPSDRRLSRQELAEVETNDRIALLDSLEEVLEDVLASNYLLRFTESEFSSENVAFLLAVRKFEQSAALCVPEALDMSKEIVKIHVTVRRPQRPACPAAHPSAVASGPVPRAFVCLWRAHTTPPLPRPAHWRGPDTHRGPETRRSRTRTSR